MPRGLHAPLAAYSCHRRSDGTVLCRVAGQIDMDARTTLHATFQSALDLARPRATIVVDFAGVAFCDSTGLNALLRLRLDAEAADVLLVLSDPRPQFTRLLEVSGTRSLFTVYPTLDAALRATHPAPT
ncbi:STAS domain-containing protein [Streptomyces sp. NPDC101191]|uniref:STAS domain-containing protein n=1 Tax=Streptomyces sp. NPDC101191 TaxID=3366126 RepID=UPI0038039D61